MRRFLILSRRRKFLSVSTGIAFLIVGFFSCTKQGHPLGYDEADRYSSDVLDKWMTMQIRLERNTTGVPNVAFERYYAYSGIAAFEAIAPAASEFAAVSGLWNGLTGLPNTEHFKPYYWPASINASLANINRSIFKNASVVDKAAIDSLENALNAAFLADANSEIITRSAAFGKQVAAAVFNWSETDGYKNDGNPFSLPVGPGIWQPTPPAFAAASAPYFGNNRPIILGSTDNAQPGPPTPYSEDPNSTFFHMVKQVYDASQSLTTDQTAMAFFWRDVPGVTTAGHWLSILQQVVKQTHTRLGKAAFAYAITGVCQNEASISCWQTKYKYLLVRPITYIRNVMGHTTWNSLLTTPAHPEYSSAHGVISGAAADAFTQIFGNIGNFTDHTYDYLGFAPRSYNSFTAIGIEAGNSRLFAGIHYQPSIDAGLKQGRIITANIFGKFNLFNKSDY